MKNNLREFCERHSVKILDTNKRAVRSHGVNYNYFTNPKDYNIFTSDVVRYETEPLYTVEISETAINRIANFESEVFNHMQSNGHYNMFENLMEQKERERYLRDKYPSVKKAYENYSLLLNLAESEQL